MWQCSNCGERIEDDFELCWNCQTEKGQSIASIEAEPKSWECDACGADVAAEDEICPNCGADISEVAGPQMFCPKCRAPVDDDAEFCSSCATRISADPDVIDCPNCGKSINAQARFCKYCAADLTRTPNRNDVSSFSDDGTVKESMAKRVSIADGFSKSISERQSQSAAPGNLIVFGIILVAASALAYLWGVNYAGNFSNTMAAGLGSLVGRRDQTYDIAVMAIQFGPFGFFSGVILFVVGLVLKHK